MKTTFVCVSNINPPSLANMPSIVYVIDVNMSNAYTQSLSITFKVDYFVSTEICIHAAAI